MLAVKSENPESSRGVPVVVHCIEDGNDDVDLGAACHDDSVQVKRSKTTQALKAWLNLRPAGLKHEIKAEHARW